MAQRNLTKPFSIAGAVIGLAYMVYFVLAPLRSGEVVPWGHQILRFLCLSPFMAVFGALVGMGIGLLVSGLMSKR